MRCSAVPGTQTTDGPGLGVVFRLIALPPLMVRARIEFSVARVVPHVTIADPIADVFSSQRAVAVEFDVRSTLPLWQ